MKALLEKTAWTMAVPAPYSLFHLLFVLFGLVAAAFGAYYTRKMVNISKNPCLLFFCGLILAAAECWKQLFLYVIVNQNSFDWWYFPFQLCSLPMYFCLLLPLVPERLKRLLSTFMADFCLLGGVMALAEPSGLLHPYWFLTLHGLLWHLLLIYIGLVFSFSTLPDCSMRGFVKILPLFFLCCAVASIINRTARPLGQADMFYISPYYPSSQVVFHDIAVKYGTLAGNVVYLLATCLGGLLFHILSGKFRLFPQWCKQRIKKGLICREET